MFRPRTAPLIFTLLSLALLLLATNKSVSAQTSSPTATGFATDIRAWTSNGSTFVEVRLTFPNTGFSVSDWGQVTRNGNSFVADAKVERYNGASGQMIVVKEHTYNLGVVEAGTHTFTFESYGTPVKSLQFDPSAIAEHFEPATLPASNAGVRIWTTEGTTYTKVELYLPDTGYRVTDWGQVTRSGNDFSVDVKLEHFTGESEANISIAAQDFPLGVLASGSYTLTIKINGTSVRTQPFSITASSAPAPKLMTEENSERAIALDSVTWMRLFPVIAPHSFSPDGRARITLLASNINLSSTETSSVVTAQAEDAQHKVYPLAVEYVGKVPGFDWVTQIIVKPPDDFVDGGDVWLNVSVRGVSSNKALINIKSSAANAQ